MNKKKFYILGILLYIQGFPGGSVVENPPAKQEIPESGRSPGEGNGNPLQYSCLVGYSPWARKELDTTEQLKTTVCTSSPLPRAVSCPTELLRTLNQVRNSLTQGSNNKMI